LSEVTSENNDQAQTDTQEKNEVVLNIALDSFIPETYIPNEDERMKVYMAVSKIKSSSERDKILAHLSDLYGKPPREVCNIVTAGYIRMLGNALNVKLISLNRFGDCKITFNSTIDQHEMIEKINANSPKSAQLTQGINLIAKPHDASITGIIKFLESINRG
jgi:transcription-repair coupling factor (superfamily II helicase)